MAETKRHRIEIMRKQLESERSSFIPQWKDIGEYNAPRRPRFLISDVNRGDRRNQKIIDNTAYCARRTLRSGMMSGVTSPARPWFRLTTPDPAQAELGPVKDWLYFVSQRTSSVFLKSNLYNVLPIVYGDMADFATAAMFVEEDFAEVIRCTSIPIGSFMIANDSKGRVNVFMREFRMTVRQLIEKFGERKKGQIDWSNFSVYVKNQYDQNNLETWIDIVHAVYPNPDYDDKRLHSKFKKYASCYYEKNNGTDEDKFLRESGYDYFPVLCPRWEVTGEDAYGTDSPGMVSLGDNRQLQLGEKKIAKAIDKMVDPPMVGPAALRNQKSSILPGDITYLDSRDGQQGFRPAHEINPRIAELEEKQVQVRQRISRAYFEDLFLMLASSDRRNITAREVEERHEEKLLALGPVLEQLNQDLLDPLIDITFDIMVRQGKIPPPPEEMQGMELRVEYISIMAQSQKLVGIAGVERFAGFAQGVLTVAPQAADKVDFDQLLDIYGDMTSVPPGVITPDEKVIDIRKKREQAQQAQMQQEAIQQSSMAAKNLSQTDLEGDNVLSRMIEDANAGAL